jgi:hypothetical protein
MIAQACAVCSPKTGTQAPLLCCETIWLRMSLTVAFFRSHGPTRNEIATRRVAYNSAAVRIRDEIQVILTTVRALATDRCASGPVILVLLTFPESAE